MNTEQRLNELEKRVASLERMLATNLGQGSPQPPPRPPLPEAIKKLGNQPTVQGPTPPTGQRPILPKNLSEALKKTPPPVNLAGMTPDNTLGSHLANDVSHPEAGQ